MLARYCGSPYHIPFTLGGILFTFSFAVFHGAFFVLGPADGQSSGSTSDQSPSIAASFLSFGTSHFADVRDLAVTVSGMIRTFDKCLEPFWANIVLPNGKVDVFMHLFYRTDDELSRFLGQLDRVAGDGGCTKQGQGQCVRGLNLTKWEDSMYVAVATSVEGYPFERRINESNVNTTLAMYYGIFMANQMRARYSEERNVQYRFALRWRGDLKASEPILLGSFSNEHVWVPEGNNFRKGLNDQVALSSPRNIDVYCDAYRCIPSLYRSGVLFHSETMLKEHLRSQNLTVRRWPFNYRIKRT